MKSKFDKEFLCKIDNMPQHLKPVVEMATKDAMNAPMAKIFFEFDFDKRKIFSGFANFFYLYYPSFL